MFDAEEELKELAAQLRQPSGDLGIEVGAIMNDTNGNMTLHSIDNLDIVDGNSILELGHGNAGHLPYLMSKSEDLNYHGLELSQTMHDEAKLANRDLLENESAFFYLYDGVKIPFDDDKFDRIFTVNTIYFWENPQELIAELYRVLKPGGRLNITFSQKDFMKNLPFTKFGFELYDENRITTLVKSTDFEIVGFKNETENVKSKDGKMVSRTFTTLSLTK